MKRYLLLLMTLCALTVIGCSEKIDTPDDDDTQTENPGGGNKPENPGGGDSDNTGGNQPENPGGGNQPENPGGDEQKEPEIPEYQGPDEDLAGPMESIFPDAVFRAYVLANFDTDKNGKITKREAYEVRTINVTKEQYGPASEKISSLQGIEQFPYLQTLLCAYNKLERIDVLKNTYLKELDCSGNSLSSLTLTTNTALESLTCNSNNLTTLNVSNNTALKVLKYMFNSVSDINISKNTKLTDLWCSYNSINNLDVSNNTALRTLRCNGNNLQILDLYYNSELVSVWCQTNQLSALNVANTNLGNSTEDVPLNCISNPNLRALYIKRGWTIKYIYPTPNYSYLQPTAQIIFE